MSRTKIIDIYKEVIGQQTGNRAMFGDSFPGTMEFMDAYLVEYNNFDRYFAHKYTTFEYEDILSTSSPVSSFQNDFFSFLTININKLKELYRMEVIDDTLYSLYNNYDMTETAHSEATIDTGSRTDTQSVNPYDGTTFTQSGQNEMGAQHNTSGGDSTLHRVGNIGVMTVSDMLTRHDELFSKYVSFYDKLFAMFADEYLYIGGY